jgi:hypothetical protein
MSDKHTITVSDDAPLIAIPDEENGHAVTRYFTDEAAADAHLREKRIRAALEAIGSASDIDTTDEEMLAQLHRIRHESKPTPLTNLDL